MSNETPGRRLNLVLTDGAAARLERIREQLDATTDSEAIRRMIRFCPLAAEFVDPAGTITFLLPSGEKKSLLM